MLDLGKFVVLGNIEEGGTRAVEYMGPIRQAQHNHLGHINPAPTRTSSKGQVGLRHTHLGH